MNTVVKEMHYALETGWDRNSAIRHGIEEIERLEKENKILKGLRNNDTTECDDDCIFD